MREGRLASNADDRRFDSDREDRNPPSNGQLHTHTHTHVWLLATLLIEVNHLFVLHAVLIMRGMDALSDENSVIVNWMWNIPCY